MVQRIDFEGMIYEFPDDFSEKEISDALATMPRGGPGALQPSIEVEAPDGTIVEFPAGSSTELMTSVMREHYGRPSPVAPTADSITRDLVNQSTRTAGQN